MTGAPDPGSRKRRWSDLSPRTRAAIVAAGVVQNSLLVATLIDLRRRPARKIRGDKRLWTAAAFVSWVGPISYFTYGRKRRAPRRPRRSWR